MVNKDEGKLRKPQGEMLYREMPFKGRKFPFRGKKSFLGFKNKMGKRAIIPGTVALSEGSAILKRAGKGSFLFQPH